MSVSPEKDSTALTVTGHDVWTALSPVFKLMQCMGMKHFEIKGPVNRRTFSRIKVYAPSRLVFYHFVALLTVLIVYTNHYDPRIRKVGVVQHYIKLYEAYSSVLLVLCVIFNTVCTGRHLMEIIGRVMEVDRQICVLGMRIDNVRARNMNVFWILLYLGCFTVGYTYSYSLRWYDWRAWLINSLYLITNLYKVAVGIVFRGWIYSIEQRFRGVSENLCWMRRARCFNLCAKSFGLWAVGEGGAQKRICAESVRALAAIYHDLFRVIEDTNKFSFLPTVMDFGMSFSIACIHMYEMVGAFYREIEVGTKEVVRIMFGVYWVCVYVLDMVLLIGYCDSVARQGLTYGPAHVYRNRFPPQYSSPNMEGFERAPSDIFTSLGPSLALQKCLGLTEFVVEGPVGDRAARRDFFLRGLYKTAFYLCFAAFCSVSVYVGDFLRAPSSGNIIYWFVTVYENHWDLILVLTLLVNSQMNGRALLEALTDAVEIDRALERRGLRPDNLTARWLFVCLISAYLLLVLIINVVYHFLDDEDPSHLVVLSIFLVNSVYKAWLTVSFRVWMFMLCQRFALLGRRFGRTRTAEEVAELTELYARTRHVATVVNRVYSYPILVNLGYDFLVLLVYFHRLVVLYFDTVSEMVVTRGGLLFRLVDCGSLIVFCAFYTMHANRVKKELFKLTVANTDQEFRREINAFSLQLLHDEVKISAGGFFTIDIPLIFTMVGAGTTYLIILIQFDLATLKG